MEHGGGRSKYSNTTQFGKTITSLKDTIRYEYYCYSNFDCSVNFAISLIVKILKNTIYVDFVGLELTRLFQLVGDDTTDEVRLGRPQSGHQVVKLFLGVQRSS